ncbi:rab-GTPase-TBC domain-containing protein [Biscogniauxia mediterranea]|nr:rab-GTPase-TBC domain-containing protein [Biscogniauxia mediterranea]
MSLALVDSMPTHEEKPSSEAGLRIDDSPALSDKETDNFEDAIDTGSIRSLTSRKIPQPQPVRPPSAGSDGTSSASESPTQEKQDGDDDGAVEQNGDTAEYTTEHPAEHTAEHTTEDKAEDKVVKTEETHKAESIVEQHDAATESTPTSKRTSNASLDNVDLGDTSSAERPSVELSLASPVEPPSVVELPKVEQLPVAEKKPGKKLSLSNIANSLPSMPWSPPNNTNNTDTPPKSSPNPSTAPAAAAASIAPPPPPTRKITSPFSWLSRNSTPKEPAASPAAGVSRRNTTSSVVTVTSNPDMMLSKLEEEKGGASTNGNHRPARNSLKDRFKMVRMREEAGISLNEDDEPLGAISNVATPTVETTPEETPVNAVQPPPPSPLPPTADTNLAPGTVSGVSAGPSAMSDAQVDWDLWQSVVYEGPAAVARTSPEELNMAIATGIPNVIRGVVWQVLAHSKNEELEAVYKELIARGTDKDKRKNRTSNDTTISVSSTNLNAEKEPVKSSSSSVVSEKSGGSGKKSPTMQPEPEPTQKAPAMSAADKKKKEKEDAAALSRLEKSIRRDLGARTSYSKYAAAAGLQEGLFGVCKAYALYDEAVGYAQGMNFLIMPLLFNMPEEEAFCLLVQLMNKYKLRDLFVQDMPGLHMHLYQFERLLEDLEPALYCHLHRRGISPHLYATQWFLTLFAYRFPLQLVLRIYDLILSEGLEAILKFGIVLMQKNATTLLGMTDMGQLTTFLKDKVFDVYIDQSPSAGSILENGFFGSSSSSIDKEVYRADQLVRDACEVKVTPEILKAYTTEWEEKTRAEKEREQELEQLRSSNISLTIKVRKLEERIEASDREQASMATDLVHTKVENEELKDKNESLMGQVKELRNVIEKQPEEIEQTWNLERDDLMKRNEKVHEENTKLEKEMAELEEELVQTKMRYAEINSQHETLQRKWQDLKRHIA